MEASCSVLLAPDQFSPSFDSRVDFDEESIDLRVSEFSVKTFADLFIGSDRKVFSANEIVKIYGVNSLLSRSFLSVTSEDEKGAYFTGPFDYNFLISIRF